MSREEVSLLGQLEQRGYQTREDDPDDKRSKRIALTARGTAVVTTIRQTVAEIEDKWAQELGPERLDQLRTLLRDLNATDSPAR